MTPRQRTELWAMIVEYGNARADVDKRSYYAGVIDQVLDRIANPREVEGEVNPNHPVTQAVHDHWHKIAALLVLKHGHTVITSADIDGLRERSIVAHDRADGLHLYVVSIDEAARLVGKEGGLPT